MAMGKWLTDEQITDIYNLYAEGKTIRQISNAMGLKYRTVYTYLGGNIRLFKNDICEIAKQYKVPVEEIDDWLVVVIY